jgi:hypothetical protein
VVVCDGCKLINKPRDKVDAYHRDLAIGCGSKKLSPALGTSIQDRDA